MREHQIVISLKPEQLEEARRRARLAGSSSASAYLKEQIISLLSAEAGSDNPFSSMDPGRLEQLQRIQADMARMHSELQIYVSESQSDPELPDDLGETVDQPLDLEYYDRASTEWQIDEVDPPGEDRKLIQSSQNTDAELSLGEVVEGKLEEVEKARSIAENPPKPEVEEPDMKSVLDAVDEAVDELEEMADRAFAISPRLGSISSDEDDPLNDLLDDTLVARMTGSPVDEPLTEEDASSAERRSSKEARTEKEVSRADPPGEEGEEEPAEKEQQQAKTKSKPRKRKKTAIKKPGSDVEATERQETREDSDKSKEQEKEDSTEEMSEPKASRQAEVDEKDDDAAAMDLEEEAEFSDEDELRHDISGGPPPKKRKK